MPESDVILGPATTQTPPGWNFHRFSESLFILEHDGICYTSRNWLFWHFEALDNDVIKPNLPISSLLNLQNIGLLHVIELGMTSLAYFRKYLMNCYTAYYNHVHFQNPFVIPSSMTCNKPIFCRFIKEDVGRFGFDDIIVERLEMPK